MFWTRNSVRAISKVFFSGGGGGGDGGGDPGLGPEGLGNGMGGMSGSGNVGSLGGGGMSGVTVGSNTTVDGSQANTGTTVSGAATGMGQGGYAQSSDNPALGNQAANLGIGFAGQLGSGQLGMGTVTGGLSGEGAFSHALGNQAANLGIGLAGQIGSGNLASGITGLSGLSAAAAEGFGSELGQQVLSDQITASFANQAIANANLGLGNTMAANFGALTGGMPSGLGTGLALAGMPVNEGLALASALGAITGQGVLGGESGDGFGAGPNGIGGEGGGPAGPGIQPVTTQNIAPSNLATGGSSVNKNSLTPNDLDFKALIPTLKIHGIPLSELLAEGIGGVYNG